MSPIARSTMLAHEVAPIIRRAVGTNAISIVSLLKKYWSKPPLFTCASISQTAENTLWASDWSSKAIASRSTRPLSESFMRKPLLSIAEPTAKQMKLNEW